MDTPFISICIPAYKKAGYLQRLFESIAAQTYTNFEIVVTDDSPGDEVGNLVTAFSGSLPIRYYKNHPAAGSPGNWNAAMQRATGNWIKLMHDDDWFANPGALQQFAGAAAGSKHDFIFSACNNIYASNGKEVHEFLTGWRKELLDDNSLNLFYHNVIGHPSTVMHRRDDAIRYDSRYKWVVDIDFYIRYLQAHGGFLYIPEMLVNIGTDDMQLSASLYKNPAVEVPEYLSMLAKFPPGLLMEQVYVFHCVWNLMKRFRIKNVQMIRNLGYSGPLPDHIQDIIDFQKQVPRIIIKQTNWSTALMKRCYRKLQARV